MSFFQMSITGCALILFIVVVRVLASRRLPRSTFMVLWVIAAVRLILPLSIPLPIGIPMEVPFLPDKGPGLAAGNTAFASPSQTAMPVDLDMGLIRLSRAAPQASKSVSVFWVIWLVGILFLMLYFLISYLRSLQKFRMSIPDDTPYVQGWLTAHRIFRPLAVRSSDLISSPLTYGILRPVILLPKKLDRNNETAMQYVLTHEYVHIRRFDAVTKILFAVVLCLHWFNPLVWAMYILGNRDMELSCDACVIRIIGEKKKSSYALTLISMEEAKCSCSSLYSHFSKYAITERIEAIMKFKKASTLVIALALVLVVSAATTAFASATTSIEDTDNTEMAAVAIAGKGFVSTDDTSALSLASEDFEAIVIDGEVGDLYAVGDLIFEIVSKDEINQVTSASQTRASTKRWSIDLSGDSMSKDFEVTSSYPYAKVWIDNDGTGNIVFTITKTSPTGSVVSGSDVTIAANTSVSVYSTKKWSAATYYANFTSGKTDMVGTAACRVASTMEELDI